MQESNINGGDTFTNVLFETKHRKGKKRGKGKGKGTLTAVHRRLGEYCRSLETRSTASGGMRLWNI